MTGVILAGACAAPQAESDPSIRYSAETDIADPAITYVEDISTIGLNYREGWFEDGDQTLHFVEAGDGPLLILYHGFPSYWLSWREQIEAFANDYRVVAVDGPGAGLSSKPDDVAPYRVAALVGQLDRLAQALSPDEQFVLIGQDWGSVLAFAYAQERPERLHGVVGMSAPPLNNLLDQLASSPEQQAISNYMQRFRTLTREAIEQSDMASRVAIQSYAGLEESGDLTAREIELFHASVGRSEAVDGGMNWYRANIPAWEAIDDAAQWPSPDARLTVPALFIWGERDTIFRPEVIDNLLIAEPVLQIARLPDVGHWTQMERPELANAAIRDFLTQLELQP